MNKLLVILTFILSVSIFGNEFEKKIHKYNWDGIEVTWLEDNRFPTYSMSFYFADGALSDGPKKGLTSLSLNMLNAGTRRFSREEIAENLEFFGVSTSSNVVSEYSVYSFSGLVKDIIPTVKKVCHLYSQSTYPESEVDKAKKTILSDMKNLINNHGALAGLAFRQISLENTPFDSPVNGTMKSISKLSHRDLMNKLNYLNKEVKKKIYIIGPKVSLTAKNIILNECGWNTSAKFTRVVDYKKKKKKSQIHLVVVPKANQAQIQMGNFLGHGEFENYEQLSVATEYFGGGFTSILMKEARVNRGLTYSIGAYAGGQKDYGRSMITTFTKADTVNELITLVKDLLSSDKLDKIGEGEIDIIKSSLKGAFPFQFEKSNRFMSELMFLDHIGVGYNRLFNFQANVNKVSAKDVKNSIETVFNRDELQIVILGEKALLGKLKKLGDVKVHSYKEFL